MTMLIIIYDAIINVRPNGITTGTSKNFQTALFRKLKLYTWELNMDDGNNK
jgi:hypothetical protein